MELNGLKTEYLGRNLIFYKTLDSTQKKIKLLNNPINGTVILSNNQFEAIGTHSRKWYTGNGKNIAMSILLLPNCNVSKLKDVTINIAQCIVSTLKILYNVELKIQEPNDIFYKGKKMGGILTEITTKGENVNNLYIGIGLNVNQDEFPGNLSEIATSLKKEFNKEFDRQEIIVEFLNQFEKAYNNIIK